MKYSYMPWVIAIIAGWLIAAPFVLGYADTNIAMNNDIAVGVVMLLGSLFWGVAEVRHHGWGTGMQAQHR
jgi:hypothetical protein